MPTGSQRPVDVGSEPTVVERRAAAETQKYLKQYNNVSFIKNDSYHDRFIIIDRKIVFHSGASFKDLGRKCFGIHEIENSVKIEKLINEVIKKCSIDN